ncbi:MAG: glyoxalase/bleomycin resistance protein/dioxygenase [Thermoleophilia bacterium]|nr:glyoxalase/bleomycin resistance protein/dioxygenase [Thermoleophilia bacterium]
MTHVRALTPFVHVADVRRSVGWYQALGMRLERVWPEGPDEIQWAHLAVEDAQIMLQRASEPVDCGAQGVLFYTFVDDLEAFVRLLENKGIEAGPITDGTPGPRREARLADPDGYVVMVAEIERATATDPVA